METQSPNSPFAVWRSASSASSSSFQGFLAPRFALTRTASPSWFISTPTALQTTSFVPPHRSPYSPEDTAVTAVERSIRVPAKMVYRTGRMWYSEDRYSQTVDIPYLHPHYSLTVITPRFNTEPTIQDHPHALYHSSQRDRSSIDHLIQQHLTSAASLHHSLRYLHLMSGLVVMPSFDALYSFPLQGAQREGTEGAKDGEGGQQRATSSFAASTTARLSLSSAGLGVGGLKNFSAKPSRPVPHFFLSAHRPFVALVRHRPTNTVLLAAKIEQVKEDERDYPYKQRKIQWMEDRIPIIQFDQHASESSAPPELLL